MENREVTWEWLPRTEAEMRYGFRLYQGGVVPGRVIRVLKIKDWDVQACGGTHLPNTGLVGPIKILRTERIQDGVERIIFAAGEAAVNWMQETERILKRTSEVFRVPPEKVPETAERFFNEWKGGAKKEVEKLRKELARLLVYELESKVEKVGEVEFIGEVVEGTMEDLREAANRLRKDKRVIVLVTREGALRRRGWRRSRPQGRRAGEGCNGRRRRWRRWKEGARPGQDKEPAEGRGGDSRGEEAPRLSSNFFGGRNQSQDADEAGR